MSTYGLRVFDDTIHTTNIWLKQLMEDLGTKSRKDAYRALRVTLQALRDRLPPSEAVHLAAQLPIFLRGVYYEGWKPFSDPVPMNTAQEFLGAIAPGFKFSNIYLSDETIVRVVFRLLNDKISSGEISDVKACLPLGILNMWLGEDRDYDDNIVPAID